MQLTAPKTLVLVDIAMSGGASASPVFGRDNTLACAVGAVSVGRIRGNF